MSFQLLSLYISLLPLVRQRAAQMQASSKRPRVDSSSSGVAPPPPSTGDLTADAFVDPTAATAPPPSTSNVSNIRRT